jgi:uncharacterized protein
MGKKKIIIDTNLIISGFGWSGKPKEVVDLVISGKVELVMSIDQFLEIKKVLKYPRLHFIQEQQERILLLLKEISTIVKIKTKVNVIQSDPSDNVILEPASEIKIDYIITGDAKHILPLKKFKGAIILTATEFLSELN